MLHVNPTFQAKPDTLLRIDSACVLSSMGDRIADKAVVHQGKGYDHFAAARLGSCFRLA